MFFTVVDEPVFFTGAKNIERKSRHKL
jgi:hypothetical protein